MKVFYARRNGKHARKVKKVIVLSNTGYAGWLLQPMKTFIGPVGCLG
jgi:hypothetical protein